MKKINILIDKIIINIDDYQKYRDDELYELYEKQRILISDYKKLHNIEYDYNSSIFCETVVIATAIICIMAERLRKEAPFRTQIQGAMALNFLKAIELSTGQGKTLTAVLSAIYRAMWSDKIHIVTANDYLAQRDYQDMYQLYIFFKIKTGYISKCLKYIDKIEQYKKHVIYISNHELGFDYLKSNMQYSADEVAIVNKDFKHLIIDEMDLILIDNARIPTIISFSISNNEQIFYKTAYKIINQFNENDVTIDYKDKSVFIKLENINKLEILICQYFKIDILELYNNDNINIFFYIDRCLRAKFLFRQNFEYIVSKSEILVIDEYTGRIASDRKFSMGIHQAIEASENLKISLEGISSNYITTQNIYRKYKYLSGMTGTIITDHQEIEVIYNTQVIKISSRNKNMHFLPDLFFTSKELKYKAIASQVQQLQMKKQPVLIGTSNIQESEEIAKHLKQFNITFDILNAKFLDIEAKIISNTGKPGKVTIATSLAGRGTDIKLGGNMKQNIIKAIERYKSSVDLDTVDKNVFNKTIDKINHEIEIAYKKAQQLVIDRGGLFVIISQKQENRRIELQFKGRAGRIQDPGCTQTYVSLEDEIFKINKVNIKILSNLLYDQEGTSSVLLSHLTSKLQKQHEFNMFYSRINVMNQDYTLSNGREVFFNLRSLVLNNKIDLVQTSINTFNNLLQDISLSERSVIFDKYESLISVITNDNNLPSIAQILTKQIKQREEDVKILLYSIERTLVQKYLKLMDDKWTIFINSKETKKRIIALQSKIDHILDYNYHIYNLFTEIMKGNEIEIAKIAYEEINKHFF
jgi:preprotein translocase subunit SecA